MPPESKLEKGQTIQVMNHAPQGVERDFNPKPTPLIGFRKQRNHQSLTLKQMLLSKAALQSQTPA